MISPKVFELGGQKIGPGSSVSLDLPIAELYTRTPMTMPVKVLHGMKAGPRLFISAALHGDELNGVEIIRRVLARLNPRRLAGTVIAVPIVNTVAFMNQSRYLPDRRDLNRSFPGSEHGSLASRLARVFLREIVGRADYGIDLHTGALHRPNLPHIRADLDHPETVGLARAFGTELVLDSPPRPGSLREYTSKHNIPVLLYEAGEALRFDEAAIRKGAQGILNVMSVLDMRQADAVRRRRVTPRLARNSTWVRAPESGILHATVRLGAQVRQGQRLGFISDVLGTNSTELKAPCAGCIIGMSYAPPAHAGDALFHIAKLD